GQDRSTKAHIVKPRRTAQGSLPARRLRSSGRSAGWRKSRSWREMRTADSSQDSTMGGQRTGAQRATPHSAELTTPEPTLKNGALIVEEKRRRFRGIAHRFASAFRSQQSRQQSVAFIYGWKRG